VTDPQITDLLRLLVEQTKAQGEQLGELITLMRKQTDQNTRAAEMLRDEFHENRKLGRQLTAVLIDVQLERAHARGEPDRVDRLTVLAEPLAAG
jgi:hypothetical protein